MGDLVFLTILLAIIIHFILFINNKRKKIMIKKVIKKLNIANNMIFYQSDGKKALVIDEEKATLSIYSYKTFFRVNKYLIGIKDILSFEIFEDNNSIINVDRGSQVGGAIVGGLLLGGVGALIGGLSGSKTNSINCNSIKINFVFNDLKHKKDEIVFLKSINNKGYNKNSYTYKKAIEKTEMFYNTITIIMKNENLPCVTIVNEDISLSQL